MYKIDFKHPIHVYFIGIGGISMSGLAAVLADRGFTVSGSDRSETELTHWLEKNGVNVYYGQRASNLTDDIDLIVYTAAIHPDNPEYAEAAARNLPMLTRAELLGQLMTNYPMPIAIAGTHGKTTTTSMLTHILLAAESDPTISVGGILPAIHGNIRVGGGDIFLTEACEYTNSFLDFFPKISVILNIDADHLDFFKDLDDIRHSFRLFAEKLPADGTLIISSDIPQVEELTKDLPCRVLYYGSSAASDYAATDISYNESGCASFTLLKGGKELGQFHLQVPGIHNALNAIAALAVGDQLGISTDTLQDGIYSFTGTDRRFQFKGEIGGVTIVDDYAHHPTEIGDQLGISTDTLQDGIYSFTGTDRRFQFKGEIGGVTIVDDYAHHPTEIKATLQAAKQRAHKTVWCVFQPHTYTRTKALMDDFAEALSLADEVVLADIYAARETDTLGVSSRDLLEKVAAHGISAHYFPSFDEIENFLLENCTQGDLLITMGAGDVVKIGEKLLGK